jgi:hypothetical protein
MNKIRAANERRSKAAEARADAALAKETRKIEREKIKAQLTREKLAIKKELYRAQAETRRARIDLSKAKRAAGDVPVGDKIASGIVRLSRTTGKAGGQLVRGYRSVASTPRRSNKSSKSDIYKTLWG